MQHKSQRVGIFIDVQNLYHSAKHLYQSRVDFSQLVRTLTAGRQLIRAIAYVVKGESGLKEMIRLDEERYFSKSPENAFFEALEKSGIDLRIKDLQVFAGGTKKADWDVGLAVDAIRTASFLDVVVLVTGDGDFVPLVEYLKWGLGRQVEVASFGRSTSVKLKEAADIYIDLDENPKILLRSKKSNK